MQWSKLKKTLALVNFVVLFILFLLYRNGTLQESIEGFSDSELSSPNGGAPLLLRKDSATVKLDSQHEQMLSSSKSMVLPKGLDFPFDTGTPKRKSTQDKTEKSKEVFLPSSKSAIALPPEALKEMMTTDSTKNKLKKQRSNSSK